MVNCCLVWFSVCLVSWMVCFLMCVICRVSLVVGCVLLCCRILLSGILVVFLWCLFGSFLRFRWKCWLMISLVIWLVSVLIL